MIKNLNTNNPNFAAINKVELIGSGETKYLQTTDGLEITLPGNKPKYSYANVFKIV